MLDDLLGMFQERASAFGIELMRWVSSVNRNALLKWAPVLAARLDCSCYRHAPSGVVIRCPKQALAACLVCREPVCLEHAVIAPNADVCCVRCIHAMADRSLREQAEGAPPPYASHAPDPAPDVFPGNAPPPGSGGIDEAERMRALRLLGLGRGASEAELQRAFKEAARKCHPDGQPPGKRAAAEARYKKVSAAYEFLKRHGTGRAAA